MITMLWLGEHRMFVVECLHKLFLIFVCPEKFPVLIFNILVPIGVILFQKKKLWSIAHHVNTDSVFVLSNMYVDNVAGVHMCFF